MTDELPPDLRALFDVERDAPGPTEPTRAKLHGRVIATLGLVVAGEAAAAAATTAASSTTATGAAITTATGITGKLVMVSVFVAATVGGGTAWLLRDGAPAARPVVTPPIVSPAPTRIAPIPRPRAEVSPPAIVEPPSTPYVRPPPPVRPKSQPRRTQGGASQRELLGRALAAVARNDLDSALAMLQQDVAHHPRGALAEERDAIHVDILLRLARAAEARAHARAFLARYPSSVHREAVARALAEKP
jgi:hypothetical protein